MKFNALVACAIAVASARYNPESIQPPNERLRALNARKNRKESFKASNNKESLTRAFCRKWKDSKKRVECLRRNGAEPRHYEDNQEKKQEQALLRCDTLRNPTMRRRCYNDSTSKVMDGAAFTFAENNEDQEEQQDEEVVDANGESESDDDDKALMQNVDDEVEEDEDEESEDDEESD